MARLSVLAASTTLLITATTASAQTPEPRRLVGTSTTRHFETKGAPVTVVETSTLTFSGGGAAPEFTIDFVAQYQGPRPSAAPSVVDIVITQYLIEDERPDAAMQVDGEPLPMIPRLRSRRSVVASIPFDDFVKLANAETIVERAFGAELEFGAGQRRMLRTVAERLSGR